jgi:TATA-box binding protein (TBP) (component of TFIID and TFIIIB)
MTKKVSDEIKKQIFKLISTPGVQIVDIVNQLNLEYELVMEILSEEYLRTNLDYGRRLCCRW